MSDVPPPTSPISPSTELTSEGPDEEPTFRSSPVVYVLSNVETIGATELFEVMDGLNIQTLVDLRPFPGPLQDGSRLFDLVLVAGYGYLPRALPAPGDRAIELLAELAPVLTLCDPTDRPAVDKALEHVRRLEVHPDGSLHTISERLELSGPDS